MKLTKAHFNFKDSTLGDILVLWLADNCVEVWVKGKRHRVENPKGQYKPCVTHCRDLIRHVTYQPPVTEFAKRRQKELKPKLTLVGTK